MTLTQILQKIKSAFYTKTETESKLSTKANSSDLNNYLPLGGGNMTGSYITRSVSTDRLEIFGGSGWEQGALISLNGKDFTGGAGRFYLYAYDGTNGCTMMGTPTGELYWGGHPVDWIEEQGDNYIRYSNGLQICWETITLQNIVQNVDYHHVHYFPKPFISAPSVTPNYAGAYSPETGIGAEDIDNVYCIFWIKNTFSSLSLFNINYTAIGRWK